MNSGFSSHDAGDSSWTQGSGSKTSNTQEKGARTSAMQVFSTDFDQKFAWVWLDFGVLKFLSISIRTVFFRKMLDF